MASTTPTITFSGLSSGLDTSSIIAQLTSVAQKPVTLLQNKEAKFQSQLSSFQSLNSKLAALQSSAASLTSASTYQSAAGSSSNSAVASISVSSGATAGDHALTVTQTAASTKILSRSLSSSNAPLGEAGTFTLNGKSVTLAASDTLADAAVKINAAGAGVSASVLNVGSGDYRLTLTGTSTGAAAALSASDSGGGTVLSDLGLVTGTAGIRQSVTSGTKTGAGSLALSSGTQTVAAALGTPSGSAASGTVQINGQSVAIDLNSDSLSAIAGKINAAGITGVTASVVTLADQNGNTTTGGRQQLQILGADGTPPSFTDGGSVLGTLGIVQDGFGTTVTSARDAKFNLDGIDLTRATNTVGDVIPNATVKLFSGTSAAPGTATLSVSQDNSGIISSVSNFVSAYNAVQDFITQQNKFTPTSATATGKTDDANPLLGDSTIALIQTQLSRTLGTVAGNTTLGDIGLTLNDASDLVLDAGALSSALDSNPSRVSNLFGLSSTSSDPNVRFLSATAKTSASVGTGFAINVTTAASQASGSAGVAQTPASGAAETLTFGGSLFTSGASITLAAGNSLQDSVDQINHDSTLSGRVYASIANGKLTISSQQYGGGNGFTVSSNQNAASNTSGIGTNTTVTDGTDVAGTINGEPATGKGRTLTGKSGNAKTEGLALLVTASTAGNYGSVTVTHGVADSLSSLISTIVDPGTGAIIGAENSLNKQIADAEDQITKIQDRVSDYTAYLTQVFTSLEKRVSALKAQGDAFAAQTGTTSSTKSAKSN